MMTSPTHLSSPLSSHLVSYKDERGEVYPSWRKEWFDLEFVEDRFSRSTKGVVRGFHGDSSTWKLCLCVWGCLELITWDIKNKIKKQFILDSTMKRQVLIPPYFLNAHQSLTEECVLHYKWSKPYSGPENQWTVRYDDPTISVKWLLEPTIISERDKNGKMLEELELC